MYKYAPDSKELRKMVPTSFSEERFRERFDIQEWIDKQPEIIDSDFLVVAKEYEVSSGERLDLLAVDADGVLAVIELKRGESGRAIVAQAIAYASYVSKLGIEEIASLYATKNKISIDEAKTKLEAHVQISIAEINNEQPRIILVAGNFEPSVASSVLWLNECGLNLTCIELNAFKDDGDEFFVTATRIIPLPVEKNYTAAKEKKRRQSQEVAETIHPYSDIPSLSEGVLSARIRESLSRDTNLTPRLRCVLDKLRSEKRLFPRAELMEELVKFGCAENLGYAGRLLSNVSQFFTKQNNGHLRQLVEFASDGGAGARKDDFRMRPEWYEAYDKAVDNLASSDPEGEKY